MAVQRARVGCTRAVPGPDWIKCGKEDQEALWDILRLRWHQEMQKGGWQLDDDPLETIQYDEQRGQVILHIRAFVWREADPTPIDYGARGGQPFGYA